MNPLPFSSLTNRGLHENFSSQSLNLTNFKFKNTNKLPRHPPRTPRKILSRLSTLMTPRDRDHFTVIREISSAKTILVFR